MIFLFIGIFLTVLGFNSAKFTSPFSSSGSILKGLGFLLILFGLLFSTLVQIEAGEVGVQTLFGKVEPCTLQSGPNFINPFVEVKHLDIKTQNYTMSEVTDEGEKQRDDAIRVLSDDGLKVLIDFTVLYRLLPSEAARIYQQIGLDYRYTIVRPITRTKIRDNAVYYDAVTLYSSKRDENLKVLNLISRSEDYYLSSYWCAI